MDSFTLQSESVWSHPVFLRWIALLFCISCVAGAFFYKYLIKTGGFPFNKKPEKLVPRWEQAADLLRNEKQLKTLKKKKKNSTAIKVSKVQIDEKVFVMDSKSVDTAELKIENVSVKVDESVKVVKDLSTVETEALDTELEDLLLLGKLSQATKQNSKKIKKSAVKPIQQAKRDTLESDDLVTPVAADLEQVSSDPVPPTQPEATPIVSRLEQTISELEAQVRDLEKEKEEAHTLRTAAEVARKSLVEEFSLKQKESSAKNATLTQSYERSIVEKRMLESSNRTLTEYLAREQQMTDRLNSQVEELKSVVSESESKFKEMQGLELQLREELTLLSKKMSQRVEEALLAAKRAHTDEMKDIRASIQKDFDRRVQHMAKENSDLETKLMMLKEQLVSSQEAATSATLVAQEKQLEVDALLEDLSEKERGIFALGEKLRESETALLNMQAKSRENPDVTSALMNRVEEVEKTVQIAEQKQKSTLALLSERDREVYDLKQKLENFKSTSKLTIEAFKQKFSELEGEKNTAVKAQEQLLNEKQQEIDTLAKQVADKDTRIAELSKSKAQTAPELPKIDQVKGNKEKIELSKVDSAILSE